MPFKSKRQARYFYANRKRLKAEGVDVSEWSKETDFKKLPEKKAALPSAIMNMDPRVRAGLDIAGLGILAEPTIHKWISGKDAVSETEHDVAEVGGLGILAAIEAPHLFSKHSAAAIPTLNVGRPTTQFAHGHDVQQPLLRNPYQDPQQAHDYELGYAYAMALGHQGVQNYDMQRPLDRSVPWRAGFAEGVVKLGRKDLADGILATIPPPEGDEKSAAQLVPGILFDIDGTLVDDKAWEHLDHALRPNVMETLTALSQQGLRMAAVTNRSCYTADQTPEMVHTMNDELIAATGGIISTVYCIPHGPSPMHKPSGAMIVHAMQQEGIDPAQCMYVGNSPEDEAAAADAGISFQHADEFFGIPKTAAPNLHASSASLARKIEKDIDRDNRPHASFYSTMSGIPVQMLPPSAHSLAPNQIEGVYSVNDIDELMRDDADKEEASRAPVKSAAELSERRWFNDPISRTIGRVGAIPGAALTGSMQSIIDTPQASSAQELVDAYEDIAEGDMAKKEQIAAKRSTGRKVLDWFTGSDPRGQGRLQVNVGGMNPISDMTRPLTRPGLNVFGRLIGVPSGAFASISSAFNRGDHYNPLSHSITMYTNEPAIMAHELGHAQDFSEKNSPMLYGMPLKYITGGSLYPEAMASRNAIPILRAVAKAREEDGAPDGSTYREDLTSNARVNRVLSAAYGTYAGSAAGDLATGKYHDLPLPGGSDPLKAKRIPRTPGPFSIPLSVVGGAIAGQIIGPTVQPWGKVHDDPDWKPKTAGLIDTMGGAKTQANLDDYLTRGMYPKPFRDLVLLARSNHPNAPEASQLVQRLHKQFPVHMSNLLHRTA